MDSQKPKINRDHLVRQTMGDADLERDVLQIFVDQMTLKRAQLSLHSDDFLEQVHSIKGSAKGVGAFDVAYAAEALESAKGDLTAQWQILGQAIDETLLEVQSMLDT